MWFKRIVGTVAAAILAASHLAIAAPSSTPHDLEMPALVLKANIPGATRTIDWRPNSNEIALGGLAGMLIVVDARNGNIRDLKQDREVRTVKYSPNGMLLAIGKSFNKGEKAFVQILETDRYTIRQDIQAPEAADKFNRVAYISSISFDSSSKLIAISGYQKQWQAAIFHMENLSSGPMTVLGQPEAAVELVAFQPERNVLAIGRISADVELYSVADGRLLKELRVFDKPWSLTALSFGSSGHVMYAMSNNGIRRGWLDRKTGEWHEATNRNPLIVLDTDRYEIVKKITLPEAGVSSVAITPDGKTVIVGTNSGKVALIKASTGQTRFIPTAFKTSVKVAISPDGGLFAAVGTGDRLLQVWQFAQPH